MRAKPAYFVRGYTTVRRTDRHTDRHTDWLTDRHSHRLTDCHPSSSSCPTFPCPAPGLQLSPTVLKGPPPHAVVLQAGPPLMTRSGPSLCG